MVEYKISYKPKKRTRVEIEHMATEDWNYNTDYRERADVLKKLKISDKHITSQWKDIPKSYRSRLVSLYKSTIHEE